MVIFFVSSQSYVPQSVVTEIYYTTTNGKPLSLDYSKFDDSVSGNVYDSNRDMFVLSFDGELSSVPASVAYIDIYAFNSSQLESAKLLSKTPCQLGSKTVGGGIFVPQTFNGQFGSASIYVPAESLYEYKADWASWADRIFPYE